MSAPLLGARRLREVLERHGVHPKKSLGQSFVVDPNTIRKVVAEANVSPSDHVLEIGPGAGSLTLALAESAARVTALEVDVRLLSVLDEIVGGVPNIRIVHADASTADLSAFGATRVVANLPYNIAASLVLRVLQQAPGISTLTVMTQKEVGDRLVAGPGSRIYGQTSVLLRYFATARIAARISRNAFYPVPNVDSVLVTVTRRGPSPDVPADAFTTVVHQSFSQRRKTLRNALSGLAAPDVVENAIAAAGIDTRARAEDVDVEGYVALTKALQ